MDPIEHLNSLGQFKIQPGLDRIRHMVSVFKDPHLEFPSIHIGGTNGKGSTSKILASILREFDIEPGVYSSPHLVRLTERFRFNGSEITLDDLRNVLSEVIDVSKGEGHAQDLTYFEMLTMAFFLLCRIKRPDISIVEVGMGGRWDATNIIEPHAVCITNISLDHMHYLGDDRASIAKEKSGIIKPSTPVVLGPMKGDRKESSRCLRILLDACSRNGCPVICITYRDMTDAIVNMIGSTDIIDHLVLELETEPAGSGTDLRLNISHRAEHSLEPCIDLLARYIPGKHHIGLLGSHQGENAACAMALSMLVIPSTYARKRIEEGDMSASHGMLNICPEDMTDLLEENEIMERMRSGLLNVRIRGRMERRRIGGNEVMIDGGHNPEASGSLAEGIQDLYPGKKVHALVGMMGDKDPEAFADKLLPVVETVTLVELPSRRSMSIDVLLRGIGLKNQGLSSVFTFRNIDEGIQHWRSLLDSDADIGLCCGSFYLYQYIDPITDGPRK